ncbi:MAG: hypothetical protein ACKOBW_18330, partial [Planctomycetota bacterium]
ATNFSRTLPEGLRPYRYKLQPNATGGLTPVPLKTSGNVDSSEPYRRLVMATRGSEVVRIR